MLGQNEMPEVHQNFDEKTHGDDQKNEAIILVVVASRTFIAMLMDTS